jgi:hypothetical protein
MNITIIGYHHLSDGFLGVANAFKNIGYTVSFFPLLSYHNDNLSQELIVDELTKLANGEEFNYRYSTVASGNKSNVILWWYFNIDESFIRETKSGTDSIHIFYSWDDPYRLENEDLNPKYKHLDICFTCCAKSTKYYTMSGCPNAYYLAPGFDPNIHKPSTEEVEKYSCDVSIVCTNLYDFDDENHINRKKFLNKIVEDGSIKLYIYGPEYLKELYPDQYRGFISFKDSHKVFSHSKINLNTHIRKNGNMYINERTNQILGSKGLLYIDGINGLEHILDIREECVVINENDPIKQIRHILDNYELYEKVKKNGYQKAIKHNTWDVFASNINQILLKHYNIKKFDNGNRGDMPDVDLEVVSKDNLLEIYDLLCSIYYSNYSINNKLNILRELIDRYNIDINLFLDLNLEKIVKQKLRTIIL